VKVKIETRKRLILFVWRRLPLDTVDPEPTEYVTLDTDTEVAGPFGFAAPIYEEEWEDGDDEETTRDD